MTNCLKFNSKSAQFKLRHLILDRCFSELPEREAKSIINSYFIDRLAEGIKIEKIDKNWRTFGEILPKTPKKYSESLKKSIQNVLEPFGLNKPEKAAETPKIVEYFPKNPKKRVEIVEKPTVDEIRELFGALMDAEGFALNQRVKPHFVLPDTRWKPTERRYIGIYDDVQWTFMSTFCPKIEENSENRPLAGGWWYRRTVPRDHPVEIVQKMETRRNIIKDCTESPFIE
ncbi:Reverse transcriptase domain-containing protein [Caenorhabditis elegans]|nr:Reverse transcriptase domain-containing protein [Caenorhabditis elegans]CUV67092.1 Reverse transcriptase domain-containing protein [Caenorhabditis elegans]|eukprot:NP_001305239.1 Enhanced RNAI (RNA interference) [Caenorhabditis elegans]